MMSIKPEITILIPAYQEAEIITSVIQEVRTTMDQTHRPYEILVIDDGSKDETASRAVSAGARVVSHPYNIGNGAAIKTGIRQAKGKILVTMDGDGQHDPAFPRARLQRYPRRRGVGNVRRRRQRHDTVVLL